MTRKYQFDTRVIHTGQSPDQWEGATLPPIYQSASHRHDTAENLSDAFTGKNRDHIYMRLTNPTNRALEEKITALEEGAGAIAMASGMAAVANTCMALLRTGDTFVSSSSLFMSTWVLFTGIFKKYGIVPKLADPLDINALEQAIDEKTRFIYIETIGNPKMDIPDIAAIGTVAHEHGIPLIVDNTMATPFLCRPLTLGADVVIHSTTKYLSGHGAATGGIVIDGGTFDWSTDRFPDVAPFVERKGKLALLDKIWREHHINFGTTQAPFHAYLTMIGLDTLALRMARHLENAVGVANFLDRQPGVTCVNYPGLENHPSHETAKRQFGGKGFGAMLTFTLKDRDQCAAFINNLKLIYHLANLGDCKTLIIHPHSTQYAAFDDETRQSLSIFPDMLRLSVGIEAVDDICEDIKQALGK
ncbi:MAG: aminotransferase class I/II-fold pyridoxal phosphate-dependent enzyme [Thermodesulfobacteriota bacterium]|nr:aminotransferase class I/II-fold pyridoxal phosphate-dependent enzyme [Thermodesulfobacteriota bacterium]